MTSPHEVDPNEVADSVAPTITAVTWRASRNEPDGCVPDGAKCEGMASISISVEASDDRTPTGQLGYVFKLLPDGEYPDGFSGWGPRPIRVPDGTVWDGISYDDEDFSFDIEVRVVDLNGNQSEPKNVHIERSTWLGCSTARSEWAILPVLAFILRRRRLLDSTPCRKLRST